VRSGRATNRVKKLTPSCPRIASGRGGHEKGDPGLLRKTGAHRPNGVRGVGGWGHAHPARALLNAAAPIQFLPPHLVFECAAAPRRRDAVKHF
jgi:hypothetical protein